MCGRYRLHASPELLERVFSVEFSHLPRQLRLRFNIAPTQDVAIVRGLRIVRGTGEGRRELVTTHCCLIPSWAKDAGIGNRMINARAETLAEKPAFRAAFRSRRCIVPASGFYEWQRHGGRGKQPYLIRRKDGEPIGFAGLWESWSNPETGEEVTTPLPDVSSTCHGSWQGRRWRHIRFSISGAKRWTQRYMLVWSTEHRPSGTSRPS